MNKNIDKTFDFVKAMLYAYIKGVIPSGRFFGI